MSLFSKLMVALAVAAAWGWFADLRDGETAWFVGRMVFVVSAVLVWHGLARRGRSARPAPDDGA